MKQKLYSLLNNYCGFYCFFLSLAKIHRPLVIEKFSTNVFDENRLKLDHIRLMFSISQPYKLFTSEDINSKQIYFGKKFSKTDNFVLVVQLHYKSFTDVLVKKLK